jgi:hypothetical protein
VPRLEVQASVEQVHPFNLVRLARERGQAGPCIPVGMQLQKAEVGPMSGPIWCLSHLAPRVDDVLRLKAHPDLEDRGTRLLAWAPQGPSVKRGSTGPRRERQRGPHQGYIATSYGTFV